MLIDNKNLPISHSLTHEYQTLLQQATLSFDRVSSLTFEDIGPVFNFIYACS